MGDEADAAAAANRTEMEFRILGPLEVLDRGRLVPLGGGKQRTLLAILLINSNQVMPANRLIDLLWGEQPPETANNVLQVYISQFRKVLEPEHRRGTPYQVLMSQPTGYQLRVGAGRLDADRFEALFEKGRLALAGHDPLTAATALRNALDVWRGPALTDVGRESFALAEIARLTEMRLQAVEERIEADLALGGHADVMSELHALVAEHPLRERLCGQLMLALYQSGRQAEASDVFQRTREVLVDQLGMEPGPKLQQLLRQILNQDPALDVGPQAVHAGRSNLPARVTTFIGREREIAEIVDLLAGFRLVTLTGTGGIGKTRLATEVAARLLDDYRDGVWLVELAPVANQGLVVKAVMYSLGLRVQGTNVDAEILTSYLKGRHQLLVLDNCEHVIEAAAPLTAALLEACPGLRILATSRESLNIPGEVAWRVPSLSAPNPGSRSSIEAMQGFEAVSLFCECASRALGTFTLSDANAAGVAGICHRLDGVPLAIELAASRLKVLSVNELNERLSQSFGVLAGSGRTAVARHQTLRATIAWSYDLLDDSERALFTRLSVFAGGFTVPAAAAVYGPNSTDPSVLELLGRLVDKSLVLPATTDGGQGRLRVLEVLRQFAHERLGERGEATQVQESHMDYFTTLATELSSKLRGPEQGIALDRLEVEHDNIRAALSWSREKGRGDQALRLIAAVWLFWYVRGYGVEGLRAATDVLAQFDLPHPSTGEALLGAAMLAWQQRDLRTAERVAADARALHELSDDNGGRGLAILCQANNADAGGHKADARGKFGEALAFLRAAGNHWGASIALNNLGVHMCELERYGEAERYLGESLELGIRLGDPWRKLMALGSLGELYLAQGMPGRATEVMTQAFVLQQDTRNIFSLPSDLEACARLAVLLTEPEGAMRFAGAADGVRRRFAAPSPLEPHVRKAVDEARRAIGPEVGKHVRQQGAAMAPEEAIDFALGWLRALTASDVQSLESEVTLRPGV